MELNGINSTIQSALNDTYPSTTTAAIANTETLADDTAAVYEKSSSTIGSSKVDSATIEKLKSDAENRYSQLKSLVEKLMTKQGKTYQISSIEDLVAAVKSGVSVDSETIAKAKEDVSDDGYWGVDQTAERIVSFAKALTGGDTSKIESMRSAIDEGYKQAEKVWGGELPEISQKTRDKVNSLLDDWAKESTN